MKISLIHPSTSKRYEYEEYWAPRVGDVVEVQGWPYANEQDGYKVVAVAYLIGKQDFEEVVTVHAHVTLSSK